jgi:hypothetical protein
VYHHGYWPDVDDLHFLLCVFYDSNAVLAPGSYNISARNMKRTIKKEKKEGKRPKKWDVKRVQILNCDRSDKEGIHWILAVTDYNKKYTVTLYEPLSHSNYSDKVNKAFQETEAKTSLVITKVQRDGWRCGYFCLYWQLLLLLGIKQDLPSTAPPEGWENLVWMLLYVKELQQKDYKEDYRALKISEIFKKQALSGTPNLDAVVKKVRLVMVQLEEKRAPGRAAITENAKNQSLVEPVSDTFSIGKSFRSCSTYG